MTAVIDLLFLLFLFRMNHAGLWGWGDMVYVQIAGLSFRLFPLQLVVVFITSTAARRPRAACFLPVILPLLLSTSHFYSLRYSHSLALPPLLSPILTVLSHPCQRVP